MSAMDQNDVFANFSNFGNPPISYAAPGVDILSLWRNGGTETGSGTSMAAPHVAGILLATGQEPATDGTVSNDPSPPSDPIAVVPTFQVAITGPTNLDHGQQGTWTANPVNACCTVDYQWFFREDVSDPWTPAGSNSDTFSWTFFNDSDDFKFAGVRVVINSGSEQAEDVQNVTIHPDPDQCQFFC